MYESKVTPTKARTRDRPLTQQTTTKSNLQKGILVATEDNRLDNWALLYAQRLALKCETSLHVCFCLVPKFLEATIRHYRFMLKGLEEVSQECVALNVSFHLLLGEASTVLPKFIRDYCIQAVVSDFSPLRTPLKWLADVQETLPPEVPLCQVDAHNIAPCWEASGKLEYAARTTRSKIQKQLPDYLTEFPRVIYHPFNPQAKPEPVDWNAAEASLEVNHSVKDVDWASPGTKAGLKTLEEFCTQRLKGYATGRNDPNKDQLSMLSPWMHFGQISVQGCVLEVNKYKNKWPESVEAFIEEAVVRRDLSDNFCFFNPKYDQIAGANDWAKQSIEAHRQDKRPFLYTREQLEEAKTYDHLWNAAQVACDPFVVFMTWAGKKDLFLERFVT